MATTPATPSNAGATTAAEWKAAAAAAKLSAQKADDQILQLNSARLAADAKAGDAQFALSDLNENATEAERAKATADYKAASQEALQASAAVSTAVKQKDNAVKSYNEANTKAASNTDPQAASTSKPATDNPGQSAVAYTPTPAQSDDKIFDSEVVRASGYEKNDPAFDNALSAPFVGEGRKTPSDSSDWDEPAEFSGPTKKTPSDSSDWDAPAEYSGPTKKTPSDSSDWADSKPFTEPIRGTTTVVENTTGGSSTTIVRGQPIDTPASQSAQQQYLEAEKRQGLYAADPNTTFGQKSLNYALEKGEITQAQYNEIKNLSAEERDARYSQSLTDQQTALDAKNASRLPGPTTVTRTEEPNTTATTVTEIQPKTAAETTPLSGAIPGTNVSTANVDGTTYQTVANADGTTSYTNENTGTSTTINDATALDKKNVVVDPNLAQAAATSNEAAQDKKIPNENAAGKPDETQLAQNAATQPINPKKQVDEFDGIDAQVAEQQNLADEAAMRNDAQNTNLGLTDGVIRFTQEQATLQDKSNFNAKSDWRVRLSLAPGADYLYAAEKPGILAPLVNTNGVIFPYTPGISVSYAAQYDATTLTHSNYKYYTYNSSSVDTITLSCDFTAQDVFEANYLLAVIHFFRSMTKMFYGQDENPKNGTPPPLCYLYGLGAFQFDKHPLVIQGFTYTLPTDVDYIRAGDSSSLQSTSRTKANSKPGETRMAMAGIQPGATVAPPQFSGAYRVLEPTYVPTKIQLSITAVPIISRNDISNNFSLKNYATGSLLRGSERLGGGIW
jgi:hypothetical protein